MEMVGRSNIDKVSYRMDDQYSSTLDLWEEYHINKEE
jgi:hypothetical protein